MYYWRISSSHIPYSAFLIQHSGCFRSLQTLIGTDTDTNSDSNTRVYDIIGEMY